MFIFVFIILKIVDDDEDGVYGIVTMLHLNKFKVDSIIS